MLFAASRNYGCPRAYPSIDPSKVNYPAVGRDPQLNQDRLDTRNDICLWKRIGFGGKDELSPPANWKIEPSSPVP